MSAIHPPSPHRRFPLLPALGLLLALGFGASALISYLSARGSIHHQIADVALPQTAEIIQAELESRLFQKVAVGRAMAANSFLVQWLDRGERDPARMITYLGGVQRAVGAITAFFVSERSGQYYHPQGVLKRVSPLDPRDAWYFRFRGIPALFEINIDRDTADPDRLTAFINQKVFDPQGNLLGVIGIGVEVRDLSEQLARIEERYQSHVVLSNAKGEVQLAGSHRSASLSLLHLAEWHGLAEHQKRLLRDTATSFRFQAHGDVVFVDSRPIPELNWWLVVTQRSGPDAGGMLTTLIQNLLIALLITLVVLWFAHLTIGDYQRRLELQAITDPLTGHYNRAAFESLFQSSCKAARRRGSDFSALLVDIDYFKTINDNQGHLAGDEAIRLVAHRMSTLLAATDLLFRWGGEEFLVLLPDRGEAAAQVLAREICDQIRRHPFLIHDFNLALSVSIGCTRWRHGETALELLERVDRALYTAKSAGRDRVMAA